MKSLTQQLQEGEDQSDLTPMIDVIFLLLLFFILTMTFSEGVFFPVHMPVTTSAVELRGPSATVDVEVLVGSDGAAVYRIDGQGAVPPARFYEALSAVNTARPDARTVLIRTKLDCPYRHVVVIMDAMKGLGLDEYTFQLDE